MKLNLPITHLLEESQNILIAGAGGGFDIYSGLPLYFHLHELGKTVHLANYSFTPFSTAKIVSEPIEEIETLLLGARGALTRPFSYFPEGHLAQWFLEHEGREEIIWMLPNEGPEVLSAVYKHLVKKLNIDTLILVDGGVDSLMRGDEKAPGSLLEDTISLVATEGLDVKLKILATIGFGTEVEEGDCHHHALENIAALTKEGAFYGACALTHQMDVFTKFEAACRFAWEGPEEEHRSTSHISTRIIPAAQGEFGDFRMYADSRTKVFISPLMNLYWFFDAQKVLDRSLLAEHLRGTLTKDDARAKALKWIVMNPDKRDVKRIPY